MRLTPYNILKGIRYLKNYGFHEFVIRLKEKSEPENISYKEWYPAHCATEEILRQQQKEITEWKNKPLISILACTNEASSDYIQQMSVELQKQTYKNYELCVAESLNKALKMATGEYIGLLEVGDFLAPNALYEVAKAILYPEKTRQSGIHWDTYYKRMQEAGIVSAAELVQPDLLYSDEDKVAEDLVSHHEPQFKPDFSLDLLRSNNYMKHFFVVRKKVAEKVGGFAEEFQGEQDYDFILKCVEQARGIVHIPKVLYHCRIHADVTRENKMLSIDWGKKAVEAHLKRIGIKADVETTQNGGCYRVKYPVLKHPLVTILIPNKDEIDSLEKCLYAIEKSSYLNYEVIIIENNSCEEETFSFYQKIQEEKSLRKSNGETMPIRVVTWQANGIFNYSAINNYGMKFANGEYAVLLNNDVEILTENWLEELLGCCERPEVGITGIRLYYPDDSIQHAGIVVGIGGHVRGVASNMLVGTKRNLDGYLHKAGTQLNYSAVTAACFMIRKSLFDEVGGFTEKLSVAFNDVDLCLKVRKLGYQIVYDPYVEAYHYESKSRGQEDSEEKLRRFQSEIEYMRTEWNDILRYGDPFYNPNFSRVKCDYSLNGMD